MRLEVAGVLLALLVGGSLVVGYFAGNNAQRTVTITSTKVSSSSVTPPIPLYKVTFNETGIGCTAGYVYAQRWYVTMQNITIVQPANATLPFPNGPGYDSAAFKTISKITFTMPDGTYAYYASLGPLSGTVTVNGSDVVVQVPGPFCT